MRTKYPHFPFWCLAIATFVLFAAVGHAQDYVYATGNPNFGVQYPVPDGYINVTNGNVHLNIPLGTFKQRGSLPPITINLEYDSRIWKIVDNGGSYSWQPTNVPNSNAGWRLVTGLESGSLSYSDYISEYGSCGSGQEQLPTQETFTDFVWTDGQGTKHTFQAALDQSLPIPCDDSTTPTSTSGWAIDSSGYSIEVSYDQSTGGIQATIYDNKGNEVYPEAKDPYGNTASYSGGTVTDSTGRTLLTTSTSGDTTTYEVLKEGGGYNTYTVTTAPISVNTDFAQSDVTEYSGTLTGIQSIQLPDGSSYAFTYGTQGYGELTGMTLPASGNVTFGYSNYEDSYQNENRWITSEGDGGGFAQFLPSVLTQCSSSEVGCQEQVELIRPGGYTRVYTLTLNDGAWDGQTVTYQGDTSSPEIMTVTNDYNFTSFECTGTSICNGAEYITASCSQVTLDDTGQTAETIYSYDSPWTGRINSKKEYDYGSSGSTSCTTTATPTRETDYTYGTQINGAPYVTEKTVADNGVPYSQTIYTYSSGSEPTSIVRGGINGGPAATNSYTYDSNGMKTSEEDPDGNTTSYAYSCDDLYLSQTTYPSTNGISHITKADPDCSSGLPLTTTGQNSQVTTYSYDSLGRESSVSYPDGGEVSYQYPSPNETVETRTLSASVSYTKTTTLDSWGRVSTVATSDPAGTDTVTTTYDGDNRALCVTNPERSTSSATDGQTCFSYDALNRPVEITQPDGHTIQVAYSGNQATVTDEDGNEKSYTYDAFHDLTKVMEPNSSGTLAWETDYTYDAGGHLLSVDQKGDGSRAVPDRTFTYDDLGRLVSETTPESGTETFTYDDDGDVLTATTGRGTITYGYDALNRVTSKTGAGLTDTYTYDVSSTSGGFASQNPIGRLVEASNGVNASEQFSYDSMGRIIYEANCIPTDCTQTGNAIYATYNYLGDLTSLTYPDGRVVTMGYDTARHLSDVEYTSWNGQSQDVDYFSSPSYDPAGQMTASTYGNGVEMAAAFNNRLDITALSYQYNSEPLWSKTYQWAANAKNLLQVDDAINSAQDYTYTYDPDNRLISSSGGEPIETSPGTPATGWIAIEGNEESTYPCPTYCPLTYDSGSVSISAGSAVATAGFGEGSTPESIVTNLADNINAESSSPVTATADGLEVEFTSKTTGTSSDYTLSATVNDSDTSLFSSPSFSATTSGATMTGGTNPTYGGMTLTETYTPDPWDNTEESGNFSFVQSFTGNNQVSSDTYDSAGDVLSDGINTYTWNVDGMLASAGSAQYTYDALEQRVEKTGGSNPGEFIYFNGKPVAMLDSSTGAWTDLIWAGSSMIAEVPGTETATPTYRLLDNEGSLVATVDNSGNVTGTTTWAPYGQVIYTDASDPYGYTGLYSDSEYGGDHAWYRDLSTQQIRWLSPDPDNGSYNLMNPQSLNRYAYVNDNPLGEADPNGLSFMSDTCSILPTFALSSSSSPYALARDTVTLANYGHQTEKGSCSGTLESAAKFAAEYIISKAVSESLGWSSQAHGGASAWDHGNGGSTSQAAILADIGAAIAVACSIDYNKTACGAPQLAWLVPGAAGKVVGDLFAIGNAACAAGPNPLCATVAVYELANAVYDFFYSVLGLGPPQFTGSLLPRPGDLGGLGTASIGIPNQNLNIRELLGIPVQSPVPSPVPRMK